MCNRDNKWIMEVIDKALDISKKLSIHKKDFIVTVDKNLVILDRTNPSLKQDDIWLSLLISNIEGDILRSWKFNSYAWLSREEEPCVIHGIFTLTNRMNDPLVFNSDFVISIETAPYNKKFYFHPVIYANKSYSFMKSNGKSKYPSELSPGDFSLLMKSVDVYMDDMTRPNTLKNQGLW